MENTHHCLFIHKTPNIVSAKGDNYQKKKFLSVGDSENAVVYNVIKWDALTKSHYNIDGLKNSLLCNCDFRFNRTPLDKHISIGVSVIY